MTVLLSPTAVRALLLAAVMACAAALMAPAARGQSAAPASSAQVQRAQTPALILADEFSWSEFIKYWGRQAGSLQGVVGTVMLVAAVAVLIIMSKGRY